MWDNYTSNNAFSVESDDPATDFQIVLHLYRSGKIEPYIFGTCQPSIRKRDMMRFISEHKVNEAVLAKMKAVDELVRLTEDKLKKLKELQNAIARL